MTDDDTTETMADVSHTNPYTGETAGRLFRRGPTVAADGGAPAVTGADGNGADEADGSTEPKPTMRDVDHTPPNRVEGAVRAFERGTRQSEGVRPSSENDR